MDENVEMASDAGARVVQESRAFGFETVDGGAEIRDFDGDVMEPFAALFDEFGDYGIWCGGFQELDARLARG